MSATPYISTVPVDTAISLFESIGAAVQPFVKPLEDASSNLVLTYLPEVANKTTQFLSENESPFASRLPLMNPFHVLLITLAYLLIVFLGKQIMKGRQRIDPKYLSIFHNAFLVLLSAYMWTTLWSEAYRQGYKVFGNAAVRDESGWTMAKFVWLFYVSKIWEFIDTFIMILKKNERQITFLHLYHHSSIFIIWWFVTFVAPTGETYFSAGLNSFVHVIMYSYYLSTTISMPIRFIKRYITLLQMTQFALNMFQATFDFIFFYFFVPETSPRYPIILTVILWFYMWSMLYLFADFFIQDRKNERQIHERKKE